MEAVTKFAYYACSVLSGLIITFFFLSALFGPKPGGHSAREVAVTLAAGAAGYGLLYLGVRLARQQHRWLAGLGAAVVAPVVAGAVMFFGLLAFGQVHWQ